MSVYSFIQKLKFRFLAKTRHGVHSPFVYDFVEQVLNGGFRPSCIGSPFPGLTPGQEKLLSVIAEYYGCIRVHRASEPFDSNGQPVLYVYDTAGAVTFFPSVQDIVVVLTPNRDSREKELWKALQQREEVKLSLDLFHTGLLFFRHDFRVKQQFVLKSSV